MDNKGHILKRLLIIILLIIISMFLYIRYIGTSGFIVKEYGVHDNMLPNNFNGLKIVHLSDIHYNTVGNEKLNKVVDEINIIKPDIVVFTGDLYDEYYILTDDNKNELKSILSKINTKLGMYAVAGNHDYDYDGYQELIEECGFKYLNNEASLIYYNGSDPIEIDGYDSTLMGSPNYDIETTNNYKIALIHEPDAIDNILDKNYNLVLSGHSHGGQVRIPFVGPISTVNGAKKYYEEYYRVNDTNLYVSYGLGNTKYNLRYFNRPSFNLYRLYKN